MNEHNRDLFLALIFGLLGVVCIMLMSCARPVPQTVEGDAIREVHSMMKHSFRAGESGSYPRSYAEQVEAGQLVVGVCSDYALTAKDLLRARGVEAEAWFVEDRHGRPHMVAVGAGTWVLDVNEGAVWPVSEFKDWEWVEVVE